MKTRTLLLSIFLPVLVAGVRAQQTGDSTAYLQWSQQEAESVGKSTYHDGKVGSRVLFEWLGVDTRGLKTERAQNYKIRATWFTPEVIRASARSAQLKDHLTDKETQALVAACSRSPRAGSWGFDCLSALVATGGGVHWEVYVSRW